MRFFFFAYNFSSSLHSGSGSLWLKCETFPNRNAILKMAESHISQRYKYDKACEPVSIAVSITNIFEFRNEEDYNNFIGELNG